MEHLSINIFTLNCWGLLGVSKFRSQRIKAIASHLNEQNYDVVFLQEIWVESDFDYIHEVTKSKLPFAYFFKNSSLLGKPGLAIISKYVPLIVHFERFITNGSPFRFWHGDWFTGKGVGYVLIRIDRYNFHLFCCHMHAQYNDNEKLDDQYSIHRLCQSFQMAKFINLITSFSKNHHYAGKDVVILAGDLNVSPDDLPYKLLLSMTGLHDSCNVYQHQQITSGSSGQRFDFTTCGHPFNTFTPPNTAYVKRIDYIFYRLISNETRVRSNLNNFLKHHPCVIDRIECSTKCASSGLSFSDHQPVAIKLSIRHVSDGTVENEDTRSNAMPITNKFEEISQSSTSLSESESNSPKSMSRSDSPGHCDVLHVEMGSGDLNGALKNRKTSESVSSSTFHMSRNACNNEIQETCLASGDCTSDLNKINPFDMDQVYSNEEFYLRNLQDLIWSYQKKSKCKKRVCFWILFMMILFCVGYTLLIYYDRIRLSTFYAFDLWSLILIGVLSFVLFAILLNHRFEMNAIEWILLELQIKIGPRKNLLEDE